MTHILPDLAVFILTDWKPPFSAEVSMMSESKSRCVLRYTKSATIAEMNRHIITAMTIPTYRATSSVLGAARGNKKRHTTC